MAANRIEGKNTEISGFLLAKVCRIALRFDAKCEGHGKEGQRRSGCPRTGPEEISPPARLPGCAQKDGAGFRRKTRGSRSTRDARRRSCVCSELEGGEPSWGWLLARTRTMKSGCITMRLADVTCSSQIVAHARPQKHMCMPLQAKGCVARGGNATGELGACRPADTRCCRA
jgi:hypothetical protein